MLHRSPEIGVYEGRILLTVDLVARSSVSDGGGGGGTYLERTMVFGGFVSLMY